MDSIFSRIARGEEQAYVIADDGRHMAILEKNPVRKGHVVVFPKNPVDFIYDMEDEELCRLQLFAKQVARALKQTVACKKIAVAVLGIEVPHAHIHLVPLDRVAELDFAGPRLSYEDAEARQLQESVAAMIQQK